MDSYASVGTAGTQEFVAPGRSVSTDHVDLAAGIVHRTCQVVEQVEQMGIEMTYLAGTMVAEIAIELGQRIRQVIFAAAVNDIEPLIGMGVIKTTPVFDRGFDSRL